MPLLRPHQRRRGDQEASVHGPQFPPQPVPFGVIAGAGVGHPVGQHHHPVVRSGELLVPLALKGGQRDRPRRGSAAGHQPRCALVPVQRAGWSVLHHVERRHDGQAHQGGGHPTDKVSVLEVGVHDVRAEGPQRAQCPRDRRGSHRGRFSSTTGMPAARSLSAFTGWGVDDRDTTCISMPAVAATPASSTSTLSAPPRPSEWMTCVTRSGDLAADVGVRLACGSRHDALLPFGHGRVRRPRLPPTRWSLVDGSNARSRAARGTRPSQRRGRA